MDIPTVLVTGFGPYRNVTKNSSWVTVQELAKLDIKDINIVAKEIPVEYETVSKVVPDMWKAYNPKLVVHCGMSEQAQCLTIEQLARNKHYEQPDVQGKFPCSNVCCMAGPDTLYTNFNCEQVVEEANKSFPVQLSKDAGRYLCEFIYYTSLKINPNTVFVHVPPIGQPHTARELATSLANIIRCLLKQCQCS